MADLSFVIGGFRGQSLQVSKLYLLPKASEYVRPLLYHFSKLRAGVTNFINVVYKLYSAVQYSTVNTAVQTLYCLVEISLWPGSNDLNEVRDREDSNNENYLCPPNHQLASGDTSTLRGETLPRPINQECSDSATRSDSLIDRQLLSRPSGPTTWGLP